MSDPRLIAVPWQDDPEPPDRETFPDDFEEAPDAHLERQFEERYDSEDDGLFYRDGVIESLFGLPEDYEPSPYDGTYSEE